jgi:hypothetical protein
MAHMRASDQARFIKSRESHHTYTVGESNLANPLVILTAIAYNAVAKLFFAACGDW